MIKIPLSDIIAKIKEKAQLTEEEINSRSEMNRSSGDQESIFSPDLLISC